jgi:hypothetical protein
MVIHERKYQGNLVRLIVSGPASLVGRLRKYRVRDDDGTGEDAQESRRHVEAGEK